MARLASAGIFWHSISGSTDSFISCLIAGCSEKHIDVPVENGGFPVPGASGSCWRVTQKTGPKPSNLPFLFEFTPAIDC